MNAADDAAVEAMRAALNELPMDGTVVIGEGERDEAPMLYIGEKVGSAQGSGPKIDIALDPLEGTTHHRQGRAQCAGGAGHRRKRLPAQRARRLYGEARRSAPAIRKARSTSPSRPPTMSARSPPRRASSRARSSPACSIAPRHAEIIAELRAIGCGIKLIPDGDVAGVIATADPDTGIDIYMGTGGAPEGVLAAAALRCVGGQIQGRLLFRNDDEVARARRWGIDDLDRVYSLREMAKGDCIFAATGRDRRIAARGRPPAQGLRHHRKHRHARKHRHDPPRIN